MVSLKVATSSVQLYFSKVACFTSRTHHNYEQTTPNMWMCKFFLMKYVNVQNILHLEIKIIFSKFTQKVTSTAPNPKVHFDIKESCISANRFFNCRVEFVYKANLFQVKFKRFYIYVCIYVYDNKIFPKETQIHFQCIWIVSAVMLTIYIEAQRAISEISIFLYTPQILVSLSSTKIIRYTLPVLN